MSKAYKDYKVSELKAFLHERGLTQTGTKPELIARLEENDVSKEGDAKEPEADATEPKEEAKQEPKEEPKAEEPKEEPKKETEPAVAPAQAPEAAPAAAAVAEAVAPEAAPEAAPVPELSPEELTAQKISELETLIERKKRFGEDTTDLETQVKRIKRFGYTPPVKVNTPRPFRNKHFKRRQKASK